MTYTTTTELFMTCSRRLLLTCQQSGPHWTAVKRNCGVSMSTFPRREIVISTFQTSTVVDDGDH